MASVNLLLSSRDTRKALHGRQTGGLTAQNSFCLLLIGINCILFIWLLSRFSYNTLDEICSREIVDEYFLDTKNSEKSGQEKTSTDASDVIDLTTSVEGNASELELNKLFTSGPTKPARNKHFDQHKSPKVGDELISPKTTISKLKEAVTSAPLKSAKNKEFDQEKNNVLTNASDLTSAEREFLELEKYTSKNCSKSVRDIYVSETVLKCANYSAKKTSNASFAKRKVTEFSLLYWNATPEAKAYGCRPVDWLDWALSLESKEKKITSQNGEDGVLEAIFEKIGTTDRYYVEFGVEDCSQCNSRQLREKGWKGMMMDGGFSNEQIGLHQEFFWVDNIVSLFAKYAVPKSFDLLSVDTDFSDFWVLREILKAGYQPRVIIVEVNVAPGPYASFTVARRESEAHKRWDGQRWFGATVLALAKLVDVFGYQLVYIEKLVVNAFFIKKTVMNNVDLARVAWQRKLFERRGPTVAHRQDVQNRPFVHICQQLPCDSSDDW